MQSQRNQRGAWRVWHRSISYHRSLVCAIRCDSPLRRPAQPVPVGQRQDPAPRECFFDGGGHRVWRCRRLPDPDASGELLCQVSGGRVHDVEELLQGGAAVDAVRAPRCAASATATATACAAVRLTGGKVAVASRT